MHVGIVSDTHDNLDVAQAAVDCFTEEDVDIVVHCGDIVSPFTARVFDHDDFDFYAVRGNNDGEWALKELVDNIGMYLGEVGELVLDDHEVAIYHGTSEAIVGALLESGNYDYVFRGHTHEQRHEDYEGTIHVNPGGIPTDPSGGEPPAAVLWDTETGDVTFEQLD
jgi:putative phosphoesterase